MFDMCFDVTFDVDLDEIQSDVSNETVVTKLPPSCVCYSQRAHCDETQLLRLIVIEYESPDCPGSWSQQQIEGGTRQQHVPNSRRPSSRRREGGNPHAQINYFRQNVAYVDMHHRCDWGYILRHSLGDSSTSRHLRRSAACEHRGA